MSQTIVVLEDEVDIARLVQYHLEGAGFLVRLYHSIGTIVADAERQPPALFLLDIMVPGGDGLDLCRRLRQNATLSVVPIIFLTARAAENDRVQGWSWARTTTSPSRSRRASWWRGSRRCCADSSGRCRPRLFGLMD